jgi:hypothetical protein
MTVFRDKIIQVLKRIQKENPKLQLRKAIDRAIKEVRADSK